MDLPATLSQFAQRQYSSKSGSETLWELSLKGSSITLLSEEQPEGCAPYTWLSTVDLQFLDPAMIGIVPGYDETYWLEAPTACYREVVEMKRISGFGMGKENSTCIFRLPLELPKGAKGRLSVSSSIIGEFRTLIEDAIARFPITSASNIPSSESLNEVFDMIEGLMAEIHFSSMLRFPRMFTQESVTFDRETYEITRITNRRKFNYRTTHTVDLCALDRHLTYAGKLGKDCTAWTARLYTCDRRRVVQRRQSDGTMNDDDSFEFTLGSEELAQKVVHALQNAIPTAREIKFYRSRTS